MKNVNDEVKNYLRLYRSLYGYNGSVDVTAYIKQYFATHEDEIASFTSEIDNGKDTLLFSALPPMDTIDTQIGIYNDGEFFKAATEQK